MSNKPLENAEEILRVHGKLYRKKVKVRAVQMKELFTVRTHEGTLTGEAGDYLVQNIMGDSKPWPIKGFIFESTYQEVEGQ